MSSGPVGVLMVAIGGYGYHYLQTLLDEVPPDRARLVGIVDPGARHSPAWGRVSELGVPVCAAVEEFYAAGHRADLAVIASPPQHHVPQCCAALGGGSHVLCDKPLGATIQEADELVAARDRGTRWVMIGYQWSYSAAIQAVKRDVLAGTFGRPVRFSTICCWPRDLAYYLRNDWAGRLRDPASGRWVLDGPANNAMAHFLHNALYLAGNATDRCASPRHVQAELYRAYAIESCDTVACRVATDEGVEIVFHASHVSETPIQPMFRLEFEEATVTLGAESRAIVATDRQGRTRHYGAPDDTPQFRKLFDAIDAVRRPRAVLCGPEAASGQTLAVNGIHESLPEAQHFPAALIEQDAGAGRRFVRTLGDTLMACYERATLPSEAGVPWAAAGARVDLGGYRHYPNTPQRDAGLPGSSVSKGAQGGR